MQLIACLLRYQFEELRQRCRLQPTLALCSVATLVGLYTAVLALVGPMVNPVLLETYGLVLKAKGQGQATFLVALLHTGIALLMVGPVLFHGAYQLTHSQVFRVFHQRTRSIDLLLVVLQGEVALAIFAVLLLLSPLSIGPFLSLLPSHDLALLCLLQICLVAMNLALLPPYLAFAKKVAQMESGDTIKWLATLLYYALVVVFGRLCQQAFANPSRDQVLVQLLHGLHQLLERPWLLMTLSLALLGCAYWGTKKLTAPVMQAYGYP